jgi:DNA-binding NarL/FixJ family response regulator
MSAQIVLVVVTDLMFQARIADAVRALGADPLIIDGEDALAAATKTAAAAVVDLHERALDGPAAVRALSDAGARVLAFGRHTEPAMLRAARESGATIVVPRSQLVDELPDLLRSILDPAAAAERH